MSTFGDIAIDVNKIDVKQILKEVLQDRSIEAYIFTTIRSRIIQKGIGSDGTRLRTDLSRGGNFYSDYTIFLKENAGSGAGKITDHVTLWGTGEFWSSLKFEILENSFLIDADFEKKDGHIYRNFESQFSSKKEFEDAVLSLTDKELNDLIENYIAPKYFKKIYEIF